MAAKLLGKIDWSADWAEDWHRNYSVRWLVEVDSPLDGPWVALNCPGLPAVSSAWIFGHENDFAAYCWPNWSAVKAQGITEGDPISHWIVNQPYTTKPFPYQQDSPTTNPFTMPPQCSGSFVKYTEIATSDKDGKPIKSISHEPLKGPLMEFDANRPQVTIEQNYPTAGLEVFTPKVDCLNDSPLWGCAKRCVKLSNVKWTRNLYNRGFFYTRTMDFDINFNTFDRTVPATGTKILKTGGDKTKVLDWLNFKDDEGNILRNVVYYKSDGTIWNTGDENDIAKIKIQKYTETNMLLLGIPTSF